MEQDRVRELLDETCRTPPLTLERNGAVIRAQLEDLHCRINVNNLADPEDEETEQALVRLIEQLQGDQEALSIDPERLVSSLRERLGGSGPDDGDGAGRDGGGGRLLASVSELLRLPGVDPEGYRALEPHITALPESGTAINAQLAPPEIRRALNLPAPEDLDPDAFGPGRYARLAISVDTDQRIHRQCAIIDAITGEVVLRRLRGC